MMHTIDGIGQTELNMQNGRFRICKGFLLDSDEGKNKGYYDHNENYTLTLSLPGASKISLQFSSFCTEVDEDILSIFDGKDTNSTLIGRYHGSTSPGTVSSTDSFITLHFISDKSVSCTGWKAKIINNIIPPKAANLSIKNNINCKDSFIDVKLSTKIHCDSFNNANTSISNLIINKIESIICKDSLSDNFRIFFQNPIGSNGSYRIDHTHGYRDFCDSAYFLSSSLTFSVRNCPITVDLTSSVDTICLGECIDIKANATGGDSTKYKYEWRHTSKDSKETSICPKKSGFTTIKVTDGNAIPGLDTFYYVVLSPPKTQSDTQLCYYSDPVELTASPNGGVWQGRGIENSNTGQFNPRRAWGNSAIVYKIGGCTDTLNVFVSRPYNYENVFCKDSKRTQPLYWYGPAGGYWTGNNVDSSGRYLADSVGEFYPTYHWQGCTSDKKVIVLDKPDVPNFDTTCESRTRDTLSFSPRGLIVGYFKGRVNAYWGWYNPSIMGGPGDYNVYFYGRGSGCRDTTQITVLPCYAGKDDTICPTTSDFPLTGFRASKQFEWTGKGINNPSIGRYSAKWANGEDAVDTITLTSKGCTDEKIIHIIGTRVLESDTIEICPEIDSFDLNKIKTNVDNGNWSSIYVKGDIFNPNKAGTGLHTLTYTQNNCSDNLTLRVLDSAIVPSDTFICEDSPNIVLSPKENGFFYGNTVISNNPQIFNPLLRKSLIERVNFISEKGCRNSFNVFIDTLPNIDFGLVPSSLCFKDSFFNLEISPSGGQYKFQNSTYDQINPVVLGSGNHSITYTVPFASCTGEDSFDLTVLNPLKAIVTPDFDSLCPGENTTLQAFGFGGTGNYSYQWSHGQSGAKAFATPLKSTVYTLTLTDGCSESANAESNILVHPEMWFSSVISDSVCYGKNGFIVLSLREGNPMKIQWNYPGTTKNDTFFAPSGSYYTAFVLDSMSNCYADTSLYIPGFKALNASFTISPPSSGLCYTPIDKQISIFDGSDGGTSGEWRLNDSFIGNYQAFQNWNFGLDGSKSSYILKLSILNNGGCSDTAIQTICYKDTVISYLPSAFTPDDDGINDRWIPRIYGANSVYIAIYNRWGQILHQSIDPDEGWDGVYLNKPVPEGIYTAYIELKGQKTAKRKEVVNIYLSRQKN